MNTKKTSGDILHAAAKGALGLVPYVGGAAAEIFTLIISPPLEKRRDKWLTEIGERLLDLEQKDKINFEKLQNDDQFIDVILQATSLVLKTSENLKIKSFQNIIVNTALGLSPNETLVRIYLNLLDNFSETHIAILTLFDNPTNWFNVNKGIPVSDIRRLLNSHTLGDVINEAFPEFSGNDHITDLVWADLYSAQLVDNKSIRTMQSMSGLNSSHTTSVGKEFIKYITEQIV